MATPLEEAIGLSKVQSRMIAEVREGLDDLAEDIEDGPETEP